MPCTIHELWGNIHFMSFGKVWNAQNSLVAPRDRKITVTNKQATVAFAHWFPASAHCAGPTTLMTLGLSVSH
jgi:hypothetical protein